MKKGHTEEKNVYRIKEYMSPLRYRDAYQYTDIDGNIYPIVKIGNQIWMTENLKVTHYRNGDVIPTGHSAAAWTVLSTGAQCVCNNNVSNELDTYGRLYNWYAVNDSRGLAPEGWRIPSDNDIKQLEMALGMSQAEADVIGCRSSNQGSQLAGRADLWANGALENDSQFGTSGFNFLPGGCRFNYSGNFSNMPRYGYFWSSTEYNSNYASLRLLSCDDTQVFRFNGNKGYGLSVRCVRDI